MDLLNNVPSACSYVSSRVVAAVSESISMLIMGMIAPRNAAMKLAWEIMKFIGSEGVVLTQ